MLRRAVLAYGLLCLVIAAVLLIALHGLIVAAIYLGVNGALIVAALLLERRRYRPALDRTRGPWLPTGERFVDPASDQEIEVRYNPVTGQRDYVDAGEAGSTRPDRDSSAPER